MNHLSRKSKSFCLVAFDSLAIMASALLAHLLIEPFLVSLNYLTYLDVYLTGAVLILYFFLGIRHHSFSRIVRYTSLAEMMKLAKYLTSSFFVSFLAAMFFFPYLSLRFIILMYLFALLLILGSRLVWAYFMEKQKQRDNYEMQLANQEAFGVRTLVVGAGSAASMFIDSLMRQPTDIEIVGIVDRDPNKQHSFLFDTPILGTEEDIPRLVEKYGVEQVTIAIPSLKPEDYEKIVNLCNQVNVKVNQMPKIEEVLSGKVSVSRLRDIDVVDLLGRDEIEMEDEKIAGLLKGKTVLVSGAGGSIGSEICRQVSRFAPANLILLGHGENSIYLIDKELRNKYGDRINIIPVIADVQDAQRILDVMQKYRPDQVYHAAAHKHVPLMEYNPTEAVKNNIFGTRNIAEAAKKAGVKSFVMISTDKAVRPTNVMGSTKRVAEMIVTSLNEEGKTKFSAVRFGNVLGSRGSVVPVFKEQIEKGGPVTVTDKRMIRYFMTIPEASRLVIQSGALAKGGEIFILDMGEPVKILDLAKKMIALSGHSEEEIPIVETGLRPGEKLYEELLVDGQLVEQKVYEKIFVGRPGKYSPEETLHFVQSLRSLNDDSLSIQLKEFANQHL